MRKLFACGDGGKWFSGKQAVVPKRKSSPKAEARAAKAGR